jgi:hypothetical protein
MCVSTYMLLLVFCYLEYLQIIFLLILENIIVLYFSENTINFQVKNLLSVNADHEVPIKSVTIRKIPR